MTDPFLNEPVTHAECRCLVDQEAIASLKSWGTADASKLVGPTCECPCKVCVRYRAVHAGIVRRARLELKLTEDGIDIGDFADIMWSRFFADGMERWMKKRVAEMIREQLVKVRLKSSVSIWNDSIQGLADE